MRGCVATRFQTFHTVRLGITPAVSLSRIRKRLKELNKG